MIVSGRVWKTLEEVFCGFLTVLNVYSVSLQLGALLRRLVILTWAASGKSPELRPWLEVSDQQGAPVAA